MKCQNCGHENDPDAKFCEKCGFNLNKSSMPDSTKILIVIVIVLVAGLGLVSGMMLMKNQAKPVANNTTVNITKANNNTTVTNNSKSASSGSSSNNNQQSNSTPTSQSPHISASQAEQIAAQYTGKPITSGTNYDPVYNYWQVYYIISQTPQRTITGYVFVDATTGNIVGPAE